MATSRKSSRPRFAERRHVGVFLDRETADRLQRFAYSQMRSMNVVVSDLVIAFLKKNAPAEPPPRE